MWSLCSLAIAAPSVQSHAPWVEVDRVPHDLDDADAHDVPVGIVGGQPSEPGDWPEVVGIYNINDELACTGTLIADDLVLTAGHCGAPMETVRVGTVDFDDDPGEAYLIAESWIHPDFYATYDVALFRLEEPVLDVAPATLLRDCLVTDYLVDEAPAMIVGYGAVDAYAAERPEALHEAAVAVVDADCDAPERGCNPDVGPGGELIAGGDGVDSCSGDSGGPLFLDTAEGLFLGGITSRAAQPVQRPCGDGGIYVRVDAVVDWVESTAGVELPRPECVDTNRAPVLTTEAVTTNRLRPVRVTVTADDPNPDDTHVFELIGQPEHGTATLEGDQLTFVPRGDSFGPTEVLLRITDDGTPPRSADVSLPLMVLDVKVSGLDEGCGCASPTPATGLALWWLGLGLAYRRRLTPPPR
jgi:hypothetical protein